MTTPSGQMVCIIYKYICLLVYNVNMDIGI